MSENCGNLLLTFQRNFLKFLSTMALTILPLTSASQILIQVLKISNNDKMTKYLLSLQFALGMTTLRRLLILAKKTASTLPCPFYNVAKRQLACKEYQPTFFVLTSTYYPGLDNLDLTYAGLLALSLPVDPHSSSITTHAPATFKQRILTKCH